MAFTCVSYNIQFGFGIDGAYNLERIIDAVRDADVILLQEVTRGFIRNGGVDMVAAIRSLLPDRYAVDHMPTDIDFGSHAKDGHIRDQRFQFGNMVLSRFPIIASRGHLLPRHRRSDRLNLQRGALEALIAAPNGPLRCISVHLDHVDRDERMRQIEALRATMFDPEGPGASGLAEFGFPELPQTGDVIAMGDFNMFPDWSDHAAMLGLRESALSDVSPPGEVMSFFNPDEDDALQRLDYAFATPALAKRVTRSWIDENAIGSDHRPVWVEFG